jgi:hypothetical protein
VLVGCPVPLTITRTLLIPNHFDEALYSWNRYKPSREDLQDIEYLVAILDSFFKKQFQSDNRSINRDHQAVNRIVGQSRPDLPQQFERVSNKVEAMSVHRDAFL